LRFDWDGYDPGPDYFDVMTLDVYGMGFSQPLYAAMVKLAGGKPIGLGEVAKMPGPEDLARQPRYCLVMGWADLVFSENPDAELIRVARAPGVLNLEDMPGWEGPAGAAQA
jgi:mannan endo-1,4-beta-mannosidase